MRRLDYYALNGFKTAQSIPSSRPSGISHAMELKAQVEKLRKWCVLAATDGESRPTAEDHVWCHAVKASCHESAMPSAKSVHCLDSFGCYSEAMTDTLRRLSIVGGFFLYRSANSEGVA